MSGRIDITRDSAKTRPTDLHNLRCRLAATERTGDYYARHFVDVPSHILKAMLDDLEDLIESPAPSDASRVSTPAASAGELRERVAEAIMESCINDPRHMPEGRWYPMLYKYEAMAALAEIAKTHDIVERRT